jgi:opacity protein-like surface antigen
MIKGWFCFFVILFGIAFTASSTFAAIRAGSSEFGISLGVLRGDDLGSVLVIFEDDPSTPEDESAALDFETMIQDEFFVGFKYSYNYTPRIGAELGLALIPGASVEASDLGELFEMDVRLFHGNIVFHLVDGPFVPFVTAGIGFASFSSDVIDDEQFIDETDFAFNFGGGIKVFLTDTLLLRVDVRDYITTPEDLETLNLIEFSGGIAYIF